MKNGYEFELSNGRIIRVVPKSGVANCAIAHGDTLIEFDLKNLAFKVVAPAGKALATIPSVVRFEPKKLMVTNSVVGKTLDKAIHRLRACQECNGGYCCVTGGCVDCGCGWICDR